MFVFQLVELHKEGQSFEVYDKLGCTPLHYAVDNGNREMVKYIIDNGMLLVVVDIVKENN